MPAADHVVIMMLPRSTTPITTLRLVTLNVPVNWPVVWFYRVQNSDEIFVLSIAFSMICSLQTPGWASGLPWAQPCHRLTCTELYMMILSSTATSERHAASYSAHRKIIWPLGLQIAGELHHTKSRAKSAIHEALKYLCNTPISVLVRTDVISSNIFVTMAHSAPY